MTLDVILELRMKTNQNALHYIKSPPTHLAFLSENVLFIFPIITEEPVSDRRLKP